MRRTDDSIAKQALQSQRKRANYEHLKGIKGIWSKKCGQRASDTVGERWGAAQGRAGWSRVVSDLTGLSHKW